MKIHETKEAKNNKSKATCGYCREEGHNQYQCSHVKGDWENFLSKWRIPVDEKNNPIKRGYNSIAYMYGNTAPEPLTINLYSSAFVSWFKNCRNAYVVQKERGFLLTGKPKRKATATRTCGFCGEENHTRRKCPTMEQFLKDCYKANENWRQACYKELVEIGGLSVGACVEVTTSAGWREESKTAVGIITKINWDTINVLSGSTGHSDFAHSPLRVEVLIGNERRLLDNLEAMFTTIGKNGGLGYDYNTKKANLNKVITHSPTPLPPEWITSYKESFETLAKKKTLDQLENGMASSYRAPNLVTQIDAWK